jgi:aspartyl-tRNA(Asn)/glutamyl-tRNA(Gln) amidotransferase subunit B
MPGVLPVLNEEALKLAARAALALGCRVARLTKFDRKSYYYPDLPKNYQISQYDVPLSSNGQLEVELNGRRFPVRIRRVHLEEDAGKLVHAETGSGSSSVDLNRAGVPLLEIVTEPDIHTPEEAGAYLRALKQILEYTGVSDARMQEGSMRGEPNVSVRPKGTEKLGVKTEVKNLNSIRAVELSLEYEIKRQTKTIESGGKIRQETMLWDDARGVTRPMRSKEEAQDYRYFPEPDLPPLVLDEAWVEDIRRGIPEMPAARKTRFIEKLGLSEYDAGVLTAEKPVADFFEAVIAAGAPAKQAANWVSQDVLRARSDNVVEVTNEAVILAERPSTRTTPERIAELVDVTTTGAISISAAREKVFPAMLQTGRSARDIIDSEGLRQVSDSLAVEQAAREALEANPKALEDYRSGKETAAKFLFGQVMRRMKGKANPQVVGEVLERILKETSRKGRD